MGSHKKLHCINTLRRLLNWRVIFLSGLFFTLNATFAMGPFLVEEYRLISRRKQKHRFYLETFQKVFSALQKVPSEKFAFKNSFRKPTFYVFSSSFLQIFFDHQMNQMCISFQGNGQRERKKCPTFLSTFSSSWQGKKLMINTHPNRVLK